MGMGGVYHTLNPRLFPGPDRLDHEPCRGPGAVRRSHLRADRREVLPGREVGQEGDRADRRRAHAADDDDQCRFLRGVARRGRRRLPVEGARRERRRRHVLHLGHHRRSQGRGLQPSLERAACDDRGDAGRHGPVVARDDPAGRADVPRQCLGAGAVGADDRRQAGHARPARWTARRSTNCSTPRK